MKKYEEFLDLAAVGNPGAKLNEAIRVFSRRQRPALELLIERAMEYAKMRKTEIAELIKKGGWID